MHGPVEYTRDRLRHDHVFGQDRVKPGERRTLIVIALTAATMVAEIVLVGADPQPPDFYRGLLNEKWGIAPLTVEVRRARSV